MKFANCVLALVCAVGLHAQNAPEAKPDVAGITLDSKGAPLRKADLILLPSATNALGEPMPPFNIVSARDGRFEFYGIPPGRYRLMADKAGYLRTRYGAKTQWGSGTVLTVRQGIPITGLEIRLPEQAVISGKVEYDGTAGAPILVLLQEKYQDGRRQTSAVSTVSPERTGEFLFNRLAPGRYYLAARPANAMPDAGLDKEIDVTTYYPGKGDQSAAEAIVAKGGESVDASFSVLKSRCYRVSGSVGALPSSGARVTVTLRSAAVSAVSFNNAAQVGPDGTFQFNSVPAGPYTLMAALPGGPTSAVVQQAINVQADMAGIFLKPEQGAPLQGKLKFEGGPGGASGMRFALRAIPPATQSGVAQVAADGSFKVGPLLPGRYSYQFMQLPPGAYLKSAKFGDKDALIGIDLTEPAPESRLELVISFLGAQIDGVILDEQGRPADGIACLIPEPPQPEQSALYRTAEAGDGGQFRFQGVRPGKYRVYAWEEMEPGSHLDPKVTAPREAYSSAIELGENETKKVSVKRIPVDPAR